MAKIKLNSLLADLRGKLGTCVFSSNGSGFFVAQPRVPRQPYTSLQQYVRSVFSLMQSEWITLSVADKNAWAAYATQPDNERYDWFGDGYYPSARAQFCSLNTLRVATGAAITASPPITALPFPLPQMEGMFSSTNLPVPSYLTPLAPFDPTISWVHVMLSAWPRPGRLSPVLPCRFLGIGAVSDPWPIDFSAVSSELFPLGNQLGRWYLQFRPVSADYRIGTMVSCTEAFDVAAVT